MNRTGREQTFCYKDFFYFAGIVKLEAGDLSGSSRSDDIWPVNFTDYDLGNFDLETRVLESLQNPFGTKLLPM